METCDDELKKEVDTIKKLDSRIKVIAEMELEKQRINISRSKYSEIESEISVKSKIYATRDEIKKIELQIADLGGKHIKALQEEQENLFSEEVFLGISLDDLIQKSEEAKRHLTETIEKYDRRRKENSETEKMIYSNILADGSGLPSECEKSNCQAMLKELREEVWKFES
nr:uncharacterized protein LOC117221120 [Megalopta genalis]